MANPRLDPSAVLRLLVTELAGLAALHGELIATLKPVLKKLVEAEVAVDRLARLAEEAIDQAAKGVATSRATFLLSSTTANTLLQQAAEQGIESVVVDPLSSGKYRVRLERSAAFDLAPKLGELLRLIALDADAGVPVDRFVPWKTYAALSVAMSKRFGEKFTRRALINLVFRLRKEFKTHQQNPFLIQTSDRGVRLAVVRADFKSHA